MISKQTMEVVGFYLFVASALPFIIVLWIWAYRNIVGLCDEDEEGDE